MATTIQRVGRRLRFRDLEVFSAVVRCGSMAKAAAQLDVTQPSVSEIVASLESAFQVRLLDRSPQGVAPTLSGQALLKRGLAALDELNQGLRDISFLTDPSGGEVRVGWPESFTEVLSGMVRAFCREHPGIALRIDHLPAPTSELPELQARKLDIALARLLPEQFASDLNVEVLFDDPAVIAGSSNRTSTFRSLANCSGRRRARATSSLRAWSSGNSLVGAGRWSMRSAIPGCSRQNPRTMPDSTSVNDSGQPTRTSPPLGSVRNEMSRSPWLSSSSAARRASARRPAGCDPASAP